MAHHGSFPSLSFRRSLGTAAGWLLAVVTSRSVVVICTTCAVLYAGFWVLAVLQSNGLISTSLPIPVADSIIVRRSGSELRRSALSPQEAQQRQQTLAQSRVAPDTPSVTSDFTLELQTAPPADLWVTDSRGGEIGTNPETGLVRLQIPGASYSGHASNPQLVSIPNALGRYQVRLSGTGTGQFQLTVRVFRSGDVEHAVQYTGAGQLFADTLLQTTAVVNEQDNGTPTLDVSPVQVLIAGNAPQATAPTPTPGPSASAAETAEPSANPTAAPTAAPAAQPVRPAPPVTVIRPRPAPQAPVPLPPVPQLPPAVINAVAPAPPSVPAPAYGSGGAALRTWDIEVSADRLLRVPRAILESSTNGASSS